MNDQWNVEGPLSMTEIPAEYAGFAREKRRQLLVNVLSSSAAGVGLANCAALVTGDASGAVLVQTIQALLPILVLTALASAFAKK